MQQKPTAGIHLSMLHAQKVLKEAPSFQTSTTEEINGANKYHLSGQNQMSSQERTKALLMEAGTVDHEKQWWM